MIRLALRISRSCQINPTFKISLFLLTRRELSCSKTKNMRFIQFLQGGSPKVGVELCSTGQVVDLTKHGLPSSMTEFLALGSDGLGRAKQIVADSSDNLCASEISFQAPVTKPDKVICIGMNYKDHCEEQNAPVPTEPVIFNKFPSCIVGPTDDLPFPDVTKELDWEVELAIVIGKKGKNIAEGDAMNHVFGYTVAHDVSARDWQLKRNGGQWLVGKTMDAFCPLGPAIVTTDEVGDPHKLGIRCRVNGVTKQDSNTEQLVFKTQAIIAFLSNLFTLLPGDVILTGTPPGVGVFKNPPEFLKKGDVVECEIDGIGVIKNTVV